MKVFVTGATGFVGTAVVQELLGNGHRVLGLARSEKSAAALRVLGVDVHRGDIEDLPSLVAGAERSEAVIHTGFNHDFSKFVQNCENDRRAIEAMGQALAGSSRPLVVTSGIGILAPGKLATEDARPPVGDQAHPRTASERAVDTLAQKGVNVSVVRLPPSTHGAGDHGFVPMLIGIARERGVSVYAGEGLNRWPAVHRADAAKVYRLALRSTEPGTRFHAVAEEGIAFKEIARAIGKGLGVPTRSLDPEAAAAHFGWFAHFAAMNVPASSALTRAGLDWRPAGPELLADMQASYAFK